MKPAEIHKESAGMDFGGTKIPVGFRLIFES